MTWQRRQFRSIGAIIAAIAACPGAPALAQQPADARALLQEAIAILRTAPLGADRVDWAVTETELLAMLPEFAAPDAARPLIARAVEALHDPHASVEGPASPEPAQPPKPRDEPHPEQASPPTPSPPTQTSGLMLADGCAYLVVPGCAAPDPAGLQAYAQHTQAEILRLESLEPRAWVIDLRLNGGGNLWPMLLGLRPLLERGPLMTMHEPNGKVSRFGLSDDSAWLDLGAGPEPQLRDPEGLSQPRINPRPIAVLIGPWTMSSGEALAICLGASPTVRSFGEATAGLTTVTHYYPLSDGSRLVLPVAAMGDRNGKALGGPLQPDSPIPFNAWPSPDDAVAGAARAWALHAN